MVIIHAVWNRDVEKRTKHWSILTIPRDDVKAFTTATI